MRAWIRWVVGGGAVVLAVAVAIISGALALADTGAPSRPSVAIAQNREIGDAGSDALPTGCHEMARSNPAGWLYEPTRVSGRLPAVVMLHKGFAYDATRARVATLHLGRTYAAHLCALGIAVRAVDYRASALGGDEMRDVDGAFDSLAHDRTIDSSRIAVMGGSHGGYMTLLALAQHRRAFVAGVAMYAFADVADVLRRHVIDNPSTRETVRNCGDPSAASATKRYASVNVGLSRAEQPLLLITGDRDEFVTDMRAMHRQMPKAEYVEIPGAPHGFEVGESATTEQLWRRATAFLAAALHVSPPPAGRGTEMAVRSTGTKPH